MKDFWFNKKVLITGHTGFKGSWLTLVLKYFESNVYGISLEPNDGVYRLTSLNSLLHGEMFTDLSIQESYEEVDQVLNSFKPDIVFHFAAQSLVIEGYKDPLKTVKTNILSPVYLINSLNSLIHKPTLVISTTDKVYKYPSSDNTEDSELGGYDFYSTSKVSKELIIDAFVNHPNYQNININKVRSGNVIGGGERGENRLFTDLILSINNNLDIEIRNPNHVRPWQYILDSIYGYLLVAKNSYENNISQTFNLNSVINNDYSVKEIAELFKTYSNFNKDIKFYKPSNFKEVEMLKINSHKAEKELSWKAKVEMDEIIELIIKWEEHYKTSNDPTYSLNEINRYFS